MTRFLILTAASAALLAAAPAQMALSQTANNPPPASAPPAAQTKADKSGPADNQIANDVDARIARLKADLMLTSDQEKNWSEFEAALHDYGVSQFKNLVTQRSTYQDRRSRDDRPSDISLMRAEADQLSARATSMKKMANAADPLYDSLDDHQKRKLVQFIRSAFESDRR